MLYDADDNRQSLCGGVKTDNTKNKNSKTNKLYQKNRAKKEQDLKVKKRREKRKILEEKIAEKFDIKA